MAACGLGHNAAALLVNSCSCRAWPFVLSLAKSHRLVGQSCASTTERGERNRCISRGSKDLNSACALLKAKSKGRGARLA